MWLRVVVAGSGCSKTGMLVATLGDQANDVMVQVWRPFVDTEKSTMGVAPWPGNPESPQTHARMEEPALCDPAGTAAVKVAVDEHGCSRTWSWSWLNHQSVPGTCMGQCQVKGGRMCSWIARL
jgi:hypothetical protein